MVGRCVPHGCRASVQALGVMRVKHRRRGEADQESGGNAGVGTFRVEMEEGTASARLDPDIGERFLALRRELGVTSFGMNQIVLQPGQRGRIHRHIRQEEVYVVLEGQLTLLVESEAIELGRGEMIRVAPRLRRQLVNRGPGRLVLLALGGATEHQGRDGEAFASWEDEHPVPPQGMPLPADLDPGELRA
jgi:mannose-6-phosphate isomerase-like protein (cupin superfamily)